MGNLFQCLTVFMGKVICYGEAKFPLAICDCYMFCCTPLGRGTPYCLCLAKRLSAPPKHPSIHLCFTALIDSTHLCFNPLIGITFFWFLFLLGANSAISSIRHEWREKVLKYSLKYKGIIQQNTDIQFKDYSCNSNMTLPASLCVFAVYT